MRDIAQIYRASKSTMTFQNFFKSLSYKNAKQVLEDKGLPLREIINRVPPAPERPSQIFVHDMIAMVFIQWLDEPRYFRMLDKLLEDRNPPHAHTPETLREHTEHATHG